MLFSKQTLLLKWYKNKYPLPPAGSGRYLALDVYHDVSLLRIQIFATTHWVFLLWIEIAAKYMPAKVTQSEPCVFQVRRFIFYQSFMRLEENVSKHFRQRLRLYPFPKFSNLPLSFLF